MSSGERSGKPPWRVVVHRYHAGRRAFGRGLFALFVLAALAVAYWGGTLERRPVRESPEGTRTELATRATEAEDDLDGLEQRLANLATSLEVERAASAQVRTELAAAQAEIARLEQETGLYRGLLDSSVRQSGLVVHEFRLARGEGDGRYRFRLVLVQRARRFVELSGDVRIAVRGRAGESVRTLASAETRVPGGVERLPFRFLYFQVIDGELGLPADFQPQDVLIDLDVTGGTRQRVSVRRDWTLQETHDDVEKHGPG